MKITPVESGDIVINKDGIKAQKIYEKQGTVTIHITLDPGVRIETHTTPIDVFFYILEGKASIEVGDERVSVEKDCVIESPKDIPRAIENFSNKEKLKVLVVKTPKL